MKMYMYMWCADGYYRAGTHAAEMAKTKGIRALQVEKQRRDAEEEQRRKQQVSQCPVWLLKQIHAAAWINTTISYSFNAGLT